MRCTVFALSGLVPEVYAFPRASLKGVLRRWNRPRWWNRLRLEQATHHQKACAPFPQGFLPFFHLVHLYPSRIFILSAFVGHSSLPIRFQNHPNRCAPLAVLWPLEQTFFIHRCIIFPFLCSKGTYPSCSSFAICRPRCTRHVLFVRHRSCRNCCSFPLLQFFPHSPCTGYLATETPHPARPEMADPEPPKSQAATATKHPAKRYCTRRSMRL